MMGDALHLVLDGLVDSPLAEKQVKDFLLAMPSPKYLDMTLILGPSTYKTQGGWCGLSVIAESHISLHSENGDCIHIDVFSCKPFSPDPVIEYCKDVLELEHLEHQMIKRGWLNCGPAEA